MADCVVDPVKVASEYHEYGLLIEEMVVNGDLLVRQARKECWKVVIEGAQGYRLDKNYGDYNDVTSSNCVSAGALIGAHLNPKDLKKVIMITKAYDSRVGNGPFPTELRAHIDENNNVVPYDFPYEGDIIREEGGEYGVTSGRPRRCGWFDAVVLASAVEANGADYICINHMDTLGKIGQIIGNVKICVSYIYQGKEITYYPDDMRLTHDMPIPVYETFDGGWEIPEDISEYDELPYTAKQFIQTIEKITGVVVKFIGIGPKDTDLIVREEF